MGSSISPFCAEVIIQYIEDNIFLNLELIPNFYGRYVDDILIIWPYTYKSLLKLLNNFNNFFTSIKLTHEIEINQSINFLDLKIHRTTSSDRIWFEAYKKPTYIDHPTLFNSFGPLNHKLAYFYSHIHRTINYSSFEFTEKRELLDIIKTGIKAGYNKDLLINIINKIKLQIPCLNKPIFKYTHPIPFCPEFIAIINMPKIKHKVIISFNKCRNTSDLLVQDRDSTMLSGGFYTIPVLYKNDHRQYIGQTTRNFKTRLNEHKNL